MTEDRNFLSRWARRKNEHREQQSAPVAPIETALPAAVAPITDAPAVTDIAPVGEQSVPAAPAPRMEDVAQLTADSDFAPFVAKNATELVKNAALKKLFSDPHFNIMDRLDIYIDDYGQADPLPEGWLEKLEHAKGWLTPTDAQRAAAEQASAQASDSAAQTSETSSLSMTTSALPSDDALKNACAEDAVKMPQSLAGSDNAGPT